MENFLNKISPEQFSNMLINLNKFQLNRKEHIKRYNKIRNMHSDILDSMESYI